VLLKTNRMLSNVRITMINVGFPPLLFGLQTRNVNTKHRLGELPSFIFPILERISSFPSFENAENVVLDQLTVC